jgi:hypothetical protein
MLACSQIWGSCWAPCSHRSAERGPTFGDPVASMRDAHCCLELRRPPATAAAVTTTRGRYGPIAGASPQLPSFKPAATAQFAKNRMQFNKSSRILAARPGASERGQLFAVSWRFDGFAAWLGSNEDGHATQCVAATRRARTWQHSVPPHPTGSRRPPC